MQTYRKTKATPPAPSAGFFRAGSTGPFWWPV